MNHLLVEITGMQQDIGQIWKLSSKVIDKTFEIRHFFQLHSTKKTKFNYEYSADKKNFFYCNRKLCECHTGFLVYISTIRVGL